VRFKAFFENQGFIGRHVQRTNVKERVGSQRIVAVSLDPHAALDAQTALTDAGPSGGREGRQELSGDVLEIESGVAIRPPESCSSVGGLWRRMIIGYSYGAYAA